MVKAPTRALVFSMIVKALWLFVSISSVKCSVSAQDQKMEGLVVQLDNYSRLGIPKLHHLTPASGIPDPAEDMVRNIKHSSICIRA